LKYVAQTDRLHRPIKILSVQNDINFLHVYHWQWTEYHT